MCSSSRISILQVPLNAIPWILICRELFRLQPTAMLAQETRASVQYQGGVLSRFKGHDNERMRQILVLS